MNALIDVQLVHWLTLFGQNVAMGMVVVALYGTQRAFVEDRRHQLGPVIVGVLFGLSAIISMLFPIEFLRSLRFDLRNVFVLVGSLFGGPVGALISTALAGAFRLYLGGNGSLVGVAGIVCAGVTGAAFERYARKPRDEYGVPTLMAAGLVSALFAIACARVGHWSQHTLGIPPEAEEALLLTTVFSTMILGTFLSMMHPRTLRHRERQISDLMQTTSDLVWETNAQGRMSFASERYLDMLGIPPREIVGKSLDELGWRPIDQASKQSYEAAMAARAPFERVVFVQQKRGGGPRLVSAAVRPVFSENGRFEGYRGIASDVTEIEKWRALTSNVADRVGNAVGEEFLRTLVQTVTEIFDIRSALISRFDFAARTIGATYTYTRGRQPQPSEFALEGNSTNFDDLPAEVLAAGKPLVVTSGITDLYPRMKDFPFFNGVEAYAAVPLVSARGAVLGLLAAVDTHPWETPEYIEAALMLFAGRAAAEIERMVVDEEREDSRRNMSTILAALDVTQDAILLTDAAGNIVYHNRAAGELIGAPDGARRGRDSSAWSSDPGITQLIQGALASMREAEEWRGSVALARASGGGAILFDARAKALPAGGAVIVATDATSRLQLEEEERRKQEREAQASRLEALGNLAGGIAHDFNNLLGAILGFGQLLVEDLGKTPEPRRFAERIVAIGHRGRSLVRQILTFARDAPVEPSTVVINDAVGEILDLLHTTLPPTTELVVDESEDGMTIEVDKTQFVQVAVNLCINGSDALESRPGTLRIGFAPLERTRPELARLPRAEGGPTPGFVETWHDGDGFLHIATGALPAGECLSLTVCDTGTGIPERIAAQIFEPFRSTKATGKGTGLGLAVVHRIVREHGGAILVRTAANRGTCFEIILGGLRHRGASSSPSTPERDEKERSTPAILVVDDDEDHCDMLKASLSRQGYRVETAIDPRLALDRVRAGTLSWNVVVTDQNMPHLNGCDLIRAVKHASPQTLCVICTGHAELTEQSAFAAGADGFLRKPFSGADLDALIRQLVGSDPLSA